MFVMKIDKIISKGIRGRDTPAVAGVVGIADTTGLARGASSTFFRSLTLP